MTNQRIPQSFIDDLLNRVDIVDVVNKAVPLKKSGKDYSACCPFHQEKSPSFTVSRPKQFYYCFGCGASGNAIGFLMANERLSFVEAVESLATFAGLEIPYEQHVVHQAKASRNLYDLMDEVARFYQQQLKRSPQAIDYLKKRGLTGQICKDYGVGFVPNQWDALLKQFPHAVKELKQTGMLIEKDNHKHYDRFRDRIMFPIRDKRGRVIAFGGRVLGDGQPKYLNSPETQLFHKGSEVYGLYEAIKAQNKLSSVIVVEGYMDVIALAQHGVHNAVATLGTALTQTNLSKLLNLVPVVVLCFDGDRAGRSAALRALENILPILDDGKQVKFMFLPDGEDPDSLIRKIGKEEFLKKFAQATNLSSMIIEHLLDQVDSSSLDGRARLAELAKPYLNKLTSEVYRNLLMDELARYTRLDAQRLKQMLAAAPASQRKHAAKRKLSLVERTISMLLKQGELVKYIKAPRDFLALNDVQAPLLVAVAEFFERQGPVSMGRLLSQWQDNDQAKCLAELAALESVLTEEETEEEFKDTISQLLKHAREADMQGLLAKARKLGLAGLSMEERDVIRDFLTESGES